MSPKSTPTKGTLVKDIPVKDTPKKDTPKKGEQTLAKKLLMPDKSTEPPIKKQQTGSPSSDRGSETDHGKTDKSKKKKKRKKKVPWLLTWRQRRLKSSRKNASGQGSGRWSCRY